MVIALVNQKGGTGKTSSTVNLGSAFASLHKKVLLVDLDPQGSLTFSLGIHNSSRSFASLFLNEASIEEVMVDSHKNLNGEVLHYIRQQYPVNLFQTHIRTNVKASEAPSFGKSVIEYAPQSNSARDYMALASEIVNLHHN